MQYAYRGRKKKKEASEDFGLPELTLELENTGMSYSQFMGLLKRTTSS